MPFDFKTGDKPWFTYDGFTKTWKSHTYNPYETYFSNKGQYVVGGDGVSKLYEGQFLVSPSYLTSPGLEYQLIL